MKQRGAPRIDVGRFHRSSWPGMSAPANSSSSSWTRWLYLLGGAYFLTRGLLELSRSAAGLLSIGQVILGAGLIAAGVLLWKKQRAAAKEEEGEDKPLRSLVFLLEQPRKIEPGPWVEQLGNALGVKLNAEGEESTTFIMPIPHPMIPPERGDTFMLQIPEGAFWIFHVHQPYFTDPAEVIEGIEDRRLQEAVARHRAWFSVDLVHWSSPAPEREGGYAMIGKIMAALAGPDVCALIAPELNRCNEFDPSLIERLRNGEALAIFENPTHSPVLNISGDDPDLQKAVAEAKRRWPEFTAAFARRQRGEGPPFIVKAPFGEEGNSEFMWVQVTRIDGDTVTGQLANQPHKIDDLHEGQEVQLQAEEIVDWVCADASGKPLGGWTQAVLSGQPGKHLGEL